jgi:hypothetical protein
MRSFEHETLPVAMKCHAKNRLMTIRWKKPWSQIQGNLTVTSEYSFLRFMTFNYSPVQNQNFGDNKEIGRRSVSNSGWVWPILPYIIFLLTVGFQPHHWQRLHRWWRHVRTRQRQQLRVFASDSLDHCIAFSLRISAISTTTDSVMEPPLENETSTTQGECDWFGRTPLYLFPSYCSDIKSNRFGNGATIGKRDVDNSGYVQSIMFITVITVTFVLQRYQEQPIR